MHRIKSYIVHISYFIINKNSSWWTGVEKEMLFWFLIPNFTKKKKKRPRWVCVVEIQAKVRILLITFVKIVRVGLAHLALMSEPTLTGGLVVSKALSLNLNFSFLTGFRYFSFK